MILESRELVSMTSAHQGPRGPRLQAMARLMCYLHLNPVLCSNKRSRELNAIPAAPHQHQCTHKIHYLPMLHQNRPIPEKDSTNSRHLPLNTLLQFLLLIMMAQFQFSLSRLKHLDLSMIPVQFTRGHQLALAPRGDPPHLEETRLLYPGI